MERIKQAVEQAQRQRQGKVTQQDPARPAPIESKLASAPEPEVHTRAKFVPASEVEYTQTKTVDVPMAVRERNRLIAAIPEHPLQDTYRMLRTRVLQEMSANNWRSIAVTSPTENTGKTLTAVNLAISLAMDLSHTALLVDADLRRPSVHRYFEYTPELGINDYLYEDEPLNRMLFHPDMDRLTVLPGRTPIRESAEALGSPKWVALLQDITNRYPDRIVVADIAPVLNVDDALTIAPHVDCILMVAENGRTKREELQKSLELLDGFPVVGTVLNKSEKKVAKRY
jgi:capsular exopolysaccharide synthesis family protein